MALEPVADHRPEAIANLKAQFRGKAAFGAFVGALVAPLNEIETTLFAMLAQRVDIDAAEGVQLDQLGAMLGVLRNGGSDAAYRLRIRAEIAVLSSRGTGDDIINATEDLVAGWGVKLVEPSFAPAEFEATLRRDSDGALLPLQGISEADADLIAQYIQRARAAGVYFVFRYTIPNAGSEPFFRFDGSGGVGGFDTTYKFLVGTRSASSTTE